MATLDLEYVETDSIIAPLRGYVFFYLLFIVPAGFLSQRHCRYDVGCSLGIELLLSVRTIVFASVYFSRYETRRLLDTHTILRLLTRRFLDCDGRRGGGGGRGRAAGGHAGRATERVRQGPSARLSAFVPALVPTHLDHFDGSTAAGQLPYRLVESKNSLMHPDFDDGDT